jgi:hypothetical protein
MKSDACYRSALPGMAWPAVPTPVAANKLALLFQMEQNQWLPPEEIAARQFDQLHEILGFAARPCRTIAVCWAPTFRPATSIRATGANCRF